MHAYQISEVRYQNFGPFEDVIFDFSQPGLTVIDGAIEGSFGCDSNGAGKSFLFDGVAWALFGRCLRERYTGDDIRRHTWSDAADRNVVGAGESTCVTVTLQAGDDTVSVARYRKHPRYKDHVRLYVNGQDCSRGTTPETTKAIVLTIGMDFNAFCNSVAFAAREDIKSFLSEGASDGERKKVLDKILGLELYGAAQKVARGKLAEATAELQEFDHQRAITLTRITEKQELLADLQTPDDAADLELRIARLRVSLRQQAKSKVALDAQITRCKQEQQDEQKKLHKREKVYEKARENYRKLRREAQAHVDEAKAKSNQASGESRVLRRDAEAVEAVAGTECPTCKKMLSKVEGKKIVRKLTDDADQQSSAATRHEDDALIMQVAVDELEAPERPSHSIEWGTLSTEIAMARLRRAEIKSAIEARENLLGEMQAQQAQSTGQRTTLKKAIKAAQQELRDADAEVVGKRTHAEMLEFWVEGFGNQGLKSFLIEAETPRINKSATRIAQRLLGPGARIQLHATRQLKTRKTTKEQLTIDAIIPGMTNNYAGASRAQKKRLDLALVLAFREVVASRAVNGFRQLFADEIFDGMDESGVEAAGDLLRELAQECPVAVISHHPTIKKLAKNYVTVYHSGNTATLRTGASQPLKKRGTRKRGQKRKSQR